MSALPPSTASATTRDFGGYRPPNDTLHNADTDAKFASDLVDTNTLLPQLADCVQTPWSIAPRVLLTEPGERVKRPEFGCGQYSAPCIFETKSRFEIATEFTA